METNPIEHDDDECARVDRAFADLAAAAMDYVERLLTEPEKGHGYRSATHTH